MFVIPYKMHTLITSILNNQPCWTECFNLTLYTVSLFSGHAVAKIYLYIQSVHHSSKHSQQQLVVILLCWQVLGNVCYHRVITDRCTLYWMRYSINGYNAWFRCVKSRPYGYAVGRQMSSLRCKKLMVSTLLGTL